MAEVLSTISLIAFVIAIVCLALTIFFGFKFKIRNVIGDLSGKNAKKSIEKIRESNEKTGVKFYRASTENMKRGKVTGTMRDSDRLKKDDKNKLVNKPLFSKSSLESEKQAECADEQQTSLLNEEEMEATDVLLEDNETELLSADTELPDGNDETDLLIDTSETALLDEDNETSILTDESVSDIRLGEKKIIILEEVMLIHTDERI